MMRGGRRSTTSNTNPPLTPDPNHSATAESGQKSGSAAFFEFFNTNVFRAVDWVDCGLRTADRDVFLLTRTCTYQYGWFPDSAGFRPSNQEGITAAACSTLHATTIRCPHMIFARRVFKHYLGHEHYSTGAAERPLR